MVESRPAGQTGEEENAQVVETGIATPERVLGILLGCVKKNKKGFYRYVESEIRKGKTGRAYPPQ